MVRPPRWRFPGHALLVALALTAADGDARSQAPAGESDATALPPDGRAREAVFERFKPSIPTT